MRVTKADSCSDMKKAVEDTLPALKIPFISPSKSVFGSQHCWNQFHSELQQSQSKQTEIFKSLEASDVGQRILSNADLTTEFSSSISLYRNIDSN